MSLGNLTCKQHWFGNELYKHSLVLEMGSVEIMRPDEQKGSSEMLLLQVTVPPLCVSISLSGTGRRSWGGRSVAGKPDFGWPFISVSGGEC